MGHRRPFVVKWSAKISKSWQWLVPLAVLALILVGFSAAHAEDELSPGMVEYEITLINQGESDMSAKRFDDAEGIFRRIRNFDPDNLDVLQDLGNAQWALNKRAAAARNYARYLKARPATVEAELCLTRICIVSEINGDGSTDVAMQCAVKHGITGNSNAELHSKGLHFGLHPSGDYGISLLDSETLSGYLAPLTQHVPLAVELMTFPTKNAELTNFKTMDRELSVGVFPLLIPHAFGGPFPLFESGIGVAYSDFNQVAPMLLGDVRF